MFWSRNRLSEQPWATGMFEAGAMCLGFNVLGWLGGKRRGSLTRQEWRSDDTRRNGEMGEQN